MTRPFPTLRSRFYACLFFVFCLLLLAAPFSAQDAPGSGRVSSTANANLSEKEKLPLELRVAQGELPTSRLSGDNFQFGDVKAHRLSALSEREMQQNPDDDLIRNGVARSLPETIGSDSLTYFENFRGEFGLTTIAADGAKQMRVRFSDFNLPAGARVWVSSQKNPDEIYGPYEMRGAKNDGDFWTPPVEGDAVVVEFYLPDSIRDTKKQQSFFAIKEVAHIFLDSKECENSLLPCHSEVPAEWAQAGRAVAKIDFMLNGSSYFCTGTMLNSLNGDLTPYFMTAHHCINNEASAQSIRARWQYSSATSANIYTDGATMLDTWESNDSTFLRLTGKIPVRGNDIRWSGWTIGMPAIGTPVTGLHHPDASYLRYSSGAAKSNQSCPFNVPGGCDNYVNAGFSVGVIEGGSSGSGLFTGSSSDPRYVGTLWGGYTCSCANPGFCDKVYGRFDLTYNRISAYLAGGSDDTFEENDTRAAAKLLTSASASAPGVIVKWFDRDWYRISVPAGQTLNFGVGFLHSQGDIDLEIYRGSDQFPIASSGGASNSETVSVTNNSGATVDYYVQVFLYDGVRAEYSLNYSVRALPAAPFKIAFSSNRDGNDEIYAMSEDGSVQGRLTDDPASDLHPSFSPDGTKIAFSRSGQGIVGIYVMNSDGSNVVRLTTTPDFGPSWSPDGTKIAFTSSRDNGDWEIYSMNINGTGQTRLTNLPGNDYKPTWSPDGTKMAFVRNYNQIGIMFSNGNGFFAIPGVMIAGFPSWSPDNFRIAFGMFVDGDQEIFTVNADATGLTRITYNAGTDTNPYWSPDGKKFVFQSARAGGTNTELYSMDANGTSVTRLTNNTSTEFAPVWGNGALPCLYTITPVGNGGSFSPNGGTRSLNVTTQSGCAWDAGSCDNWITVNSGTSGTGNGTIEFSVSTNNSGAPRTGTIFVNEQTYTVTQAGFLVVSNTGDGGAGSLRQAIITANETPNDDAITFSIPTNDAGCTGGICTVNLTSGELTINDSSAAGALTINGAGADVLNIKANGSRVFFVNTGGKLELFNLTVTGGNGVGAAPAGRGGAILNLGALKMAHVGISGNAASFGGGIYNRNAAATLTVISSHVSSNAATAGDGGGIYNAGGSQSLINTTISLNTASGAGAGVYNNGLAVLTNVTVAGNTAQSSGGGIYNTAGFASQTLNIIAGLKLRNTIVAGNASGGSPVSNDIYKSGNSATNYITSNGSNIIGDAANTGGDTISWQTAPPFADILNQSPLLAPLGNYGGGTLTHALLNLSPAVNAGNNCVTTTGGCGTDDPPFELTFDQRGFNRLGAIDIGAYEAAAFVAAPLPSVSSGRTYNFVIAPSNTQNGVTFNYCISSGALPTGLSGIAPCTTPTFARELHAISPQAAVVISGIPTQSGNFNFTVKASDPNGNSIETPYTLSVLAPTAAAVSVGGRVLTAAGRGIANARVVLTDSNGETRTALTNANGTYRFSNVAAGQTYTISVFSKRYNFDETTQVRTIVEDTNGINFTARN